MPMCKTIHIMATNLAIDDSLIEQARKLGRFKTKREAVTQALNEYIRRHEQQKVLDLFGKVDVDPAYNYKEQRRRS